MVFEKIKSIVAGRLGLDEEEVTMSSTLDDLGIDDVDMLDIVLDIEEEFDISIENSDSDGFETVEDIVKYINANA